jgi:hypothetical protein
MKWKNRKSQQMKGPYPRIIPTFGIETFILHHLNQTNSGVIQISISFTHTSHCGDFVSVSGNENPEVAGSSFKRANHVGTADRIIPILRNLVTSSGTAISYGGNATRTGGNPTSTRNFSIRNSANQIPTVP